MRPIISATVALFLAVTLVGCGGDEGPSPTQENVPAPVETTAPAPAEPEPAGPELTPGQQNALGRAESYIAVMPFSRQGLIDQLVFDQFSVEDATFAVDTLNPDWNAQAAAKAESYLSTMSFSRQGLVDQLIFDGFTPEQAEAGVVAVGY